MLRVGRLITFDPLSDREGPFARFYLDDLEFHLAATAQAVSILEGAVKAEVIRAGRDPEDPDSESEVYEACELAFCRNTIEELHDCLTTIRDIALLRRADESQSN